MPTTRYIPPDQSHHGPPTPEESPPSHIPNPVYHDKAAPICSSTIQTAIQGRVAIAQVFGKRSEAQFWIRHGEELWELGIVFYIHAGNPPRKRVCAFMSDLIEWARFKSKKREVI